LVSICLSSTESSLESRLLPLLFTAACAVWHSSCHMINTEQINIQCEAILGLLYMSNDPASDQH
jgi:hypothetical protein